MEPLKIVLLHAPGVDASRVHFLNQHGCFGSSMVGSCGAREWSRYIKNNRHRGVVRRALDKRSLLHPDVSCTGCKRGYEQCTTTRWSMPSTRPIIFAFHWWPCAVG